MQPLVYVGVRLRGGFPGGDQNVALNVHTSSHKFYPCVICRGSGSVFLCPTVTFDTAVVVLLLHVRRLSH